MSFDLDVRVTKARNRLHRAIDARVDDLHLQHAAAIAENGQWLARRVIFCRRSIGQLNRHLKARTK